MTLPHKTAVVRPVPSEIRFTVYGDAKPAGSKRAMPIYRNGPDGRQLAKRANGSPMIAVVDANPNSRDWKNAVASAARQAYRGPLLRGPLRLVLKFYRPRPKSHFRSGKNAHLLKDDAPAFPTTKPDTTKLCRGVEDALTGITWADDAQVVRQITDKDWGEPARVEITIETL